MYVREKIPVLLSMLRFPELRNYFRDEIIADLRVP